MIFVERQLWAQPDWFESRFCHLRCDLGTVTEPVCAFPMSKMDKIKSTPLMGAFEGLNELKHRECLEDCLIHSMC